MTPLEHTVKSYDEELKKLQQDIASMGSLAEGDRVVVKSREAGRF